MHTTSYTVETVTPLFLRGADGETPELRSPSFKGVLRYWWRALHPHPVEELRSEEARRFGSAGDEEEGRSPVQLRLRNRDLNTGAYEPVPTHNFKRSAYSPGQQFDLVVTVGARAASLRQEIDATVRLMLLLGGVGWRARRGMGSLRLVSVDDGPKEPSKDALGDVQDQLDQLETPFERDGRTIAYAGRYADQEGPAYPWIRTIQTGIPDDTQNWRSMVQHIANVASDKNSKYTGHHSPRISSPLHVTVSSDGHSYWPLVTSVNLPSSTESKISRSESDTRAAFRDALL